MSSESDIDEFYDASDRTPVKLDSELATEPTQPKMYRTASTESKEIEVQEELLRQEMDEIELKRSLEKLEVEQKLAKLQQRKQEEHERKRLQDEVDQASTLRSKLSDLRDKLEEETSPDRPPRIITDSGQSTPSGQDASTTILSTSSSSSDNLGSAIRDCSFAATATSLAEGDGAHGLQENVDVNDLSRDKVPSKHLTLLRKSQNYGTLPSTSHPVQEPDLIQSTKTTNFYSLSPRGPPKIRKDRLGLADAKHDILRTSGSSEAIERLGIPRGLPTLSTPSGSSDGLAKTFEKNLDIFSATSGISRVIAIESGATGMTSSRDDESPRTPNGQKASTLPLNPKFVFVDQNGRRVSQNRPRTNSNSRFLTDKEIVDSITVLNLDNGDKVALGDAEDKVPKGINPLSLHIMRRTKEYSSDSSLYKHQNSDEDSLLSKSMSGSCETVVTINTISPAGKPAASKRARLKRFFGRTKDKVKSGAAKMKKHQQEKESSEEDAEDPNLDSRKMIKIKASSHHKGPYDFDLLVPVQELGSEKKGAIWTMKFSPCGRLLATGGQDNLLRVYVLRSAYHHFDEMRQKYSEKAVRVSPAPSQESLNSTSGGSDTTSLSEDHSEEVAAGGLEDSDDEHAPFIRKPFFVYKGHTADVLDLSWSKNYFILTSSMDKTVRLWHLSRRECLCSFQHIDFVTAIVFHPKDDRYFLSGSLDGKLRLWNIPDKRVFLWNEVTGSGKTLITTVNFCLNGRFAVVGTYDGRCVFYTTDQLKYYTQIHVRSTRGKNSRGRKVTGIDPYPGPGADKILVTSNDSRIRIYDLRDLTLTCKYKGGTNNSSQIKAVFNNSGKYIICGSEDHFVYIWKTQHENYKFSSARRDRNDFWEGIKAHNAVVTAAIFAPVPDLIIRPQFDQVDPDDVSPGVRGEVVVSADFSGVIRIFINKFKPGSGE